MKWWGDPPTSTWETSYRHRLSFPRAPLSGILVMQEAGAVEQGLDWLGDDLSPDLPLAQSHGVIPGQPLSPSETNFSSVKSQRPKR